MRTDAGRVLVAVSGEVDLATATSFRDLLLEAETGRPDRLVLDLRGLSFMDGSGLRIVRDADARARQGDRRLTVVCGSGQVRRLLMLMGADQQLDLVADSDESAGGAALTPSVP